METYVWFFAGTKQLGVPGKNKKPNNKQAWPVHVTHNTSSFCVKQCHTLTPTYMFSFSILTPWDSMYFNFLYSSSLFSKTLATQASLYSQIPLYLGYQNNSSLVHIGHLKPIIIHLPSQSTPMYLFDSSSFPCHKFSHWRQECPALIEYYTQFYPSSQHSLWLLIYNTRYRKCSELFLPFGRTSALLV